MVGNWRLQAEVPEAFKRNRSRDEAETDWLTAYCRVSLEAKNNDLSKRSAWAYQPMPFSLFPPCQCVTTRWWESDFPLLVLHILQRLSTYNTDREVAQLVKMIPPQLREEEEKNHLFCTSQGLKLFICKSVHRDRDTVHVCVCVSVCWRVNGKQF